MSSLGLDMSCREAILKDLNYVGGSVLPLCSAPVRVVLCAKDLQTTASVLSTYFVFQLACSYHLRDLPTKNYRFSTEPSFMIRRKEQ